MDAVLNDNSLALISLALILAFVGQGFWLYRVGQLSRSKSFERAQRTLNWLTVFAVCCGVVQFVVYDYSFPIAWVASVGAFLWIKFYDIPRLQQ